MVNFPTLIKDKASLLGNLAHTHSTFSDLQTTFNYFKSVDFLNLSWRKRFRRINEALCNLILKAPEEAFLLTEVLDFIEQINQQNIAKEPYSFQSFEFWLNNFSNFSDEQQNIIRAKISGKFLPKEIFQAIFPVGMNQKHMGSHFVAAHLSPDTDTMIASFWSWLDAFSINIAARQHQWFLPGGPAESPFTGIFKEMLSPYIFKYLAHTSGSLNLSAMDLVTQEFLVKKSSKTYLNELKTGENYIVVINDDGNYIGEWHVFDAELSRQITSPFKASLRWFESHIHTNLISFFAKRVIHKNDLAYMYFTILEVKLKDCEAVLDLNEQHHNLLDSFINLNFDSTSGSAITLQDLANALKKIGFPAMNLFCLKLKQLSQSDLFNADGNLTENRPQLFEQLEDLIHLLDEAMLEARSFVDRLDIQLKIKYGVLKKPKNFLTLRSDVNEMRSKMEGSSFLTVVIDEFNEELFPVGIISASDLVKEKLATVSFRDFSTFDEIKMADHFEVISIIDHHKSNIRLNNVASIITGDVQSCNILLAEQAFLINDQYSTIGMSLNDIESQIANLKGREDLLSLRLLKKLYMRKQNCLKKSSYYINPAREYCEYLSFLHAILDDTDLLTKVSIRDLRCIAELLNRLKSLYLRKETEIISLDEITLDNNFIKEASNLILKQSDMYSIYKQIYSLREKSVEENIQQCIEGKDSNIFIDTKEQNGCARVGQTKVFSQNFAFYSQKSSDLQKIWIAKAHHLHQKNHSLDLFIHMISTIASAEEVYASEETSYHHLDELWIWTPGNIMGMTHLNSFLANFSQKLTANTSKLEIQLHGKPDTELAKIFRQHFQATNINYINDDLNQMDGLAVIHFDAGAVNSRKTMISPFLPRIPR